MVLQGFTIPGSRQVHPRHLSSVVSAWGSGALALFVVSGAVPTLAVGGAFELDPFGYSIEHGRVTLPNRFIIVGIVDPFLTSGPSVLSRVFPEHLY